MIEQILNGEALSSIRTKLNEVINLVNTPVLESLPDVDANKAGRKFWLNDTLWTYAKEGQFGSLAVGTPWPVKGYKEYSAIWQQTGSDTPVLVRENINEVGTVVLERFFPGNPGYRILINTAITTVNDLNGYDSSQTNAKGLFFTEPIDGTSGVIRCRALDSGEIKEAVGKIVISFRIYP